MSAKLAEHSNVELRPLGFGEIFDRAVTLYIRNFVPFAAIVMVLVLPLAFLQYFIDRGSQPDFDAMIRVFQHPGQARNGQLPTIFDSPATVALLAVTALLSYALWPFVMNAVAVGVARLYRNRPVEFRACYEIVLRRWPQIFGLIGIGFLTVFGWYIAAVVVVMTIVLAATALAAAMPPLAVVFVFVAVIFAFLLMLPLLAPLLVALTFAMYAAVIEDRGVIASLLTGFSRVFNRAEFWRAVLFSIAVAAVILGASAMFGAFALLAGFVHLAGLQAVIQALPNAIISPFGVVLLAVYYFDVRIRREAYDLQASLDRLAAPEPA